MSIRVGETAVTTIPVGAAGGSTGVVAVVKPASLARSSTNRVSLRDASVHVRLIRVADAADAPRTDGSAGGLNGVVADTTADRDIAPSTPVAATRYQYVVPSRTSLS